jgi:hypothetical protein
MFWGWLSVPLRLILSLFVGIGGGCAKFFKFVVHLLTGVREEIPTLNRLKREELDRTRVIAGLGVVAAVYGFSLFQGIFIPDKKVARIEPNRPPVVALPFDKRWQNPMCQACGGEDLDMKDSGKIAPTYTIPNWRIEGGSTPMPWYLMQRPIYH